MIPEIPELRTKAIIQISFGRMEAPVERVQGALNKSIYIRNSQRELPYQTQTFYITYSTSVKAEEWNLRFIENEIGILEFELNLCASTQLPLQACLQQFCQSTLPSPTLRSISLTMQYLLYVHCTYAVCDVFIILQRLSLFLLPLCVPETI